MAAYVLMDELHVQLRVPRALAGAALAAVRRSLAGRPFRRRLLRAVRSAVAGEPALAAVRVRLAR